MTPRRPLADDPDAGIDAVPDSESEGPQSSARESLESNAELFRALTLYSGDIISLLDADGRLLYNSPATERINGFTSEDLAHIDTFDLIHPDDRAHVGEVFRKVLSESGSVHTVRYRYKTKAGDWLWMEAIASNQLDNPAVRGVVANSRDISERVRADEERARMQEQMLHVQKLQSLGVLAGGVAHDFNNLLTVVLGETHLLEAEDDDRVAACATRIRDAAERAAELTQLLLAYAGKGKLNVEPTSLSDLVTAMLPLLELSVGKKNHLSLERCPGATWVQADGRQLRQVVQNLVQNAGESRRGEVNVTLRVGVRQMSAESLGEGPLVAGLDPGPYVVLEVEDDGEGMSVADQKRIFDPFFSTKSNGRGLGLAAVLGIVQSHGAGLVVESEPGRGTTFRICFPPTDPPAHGVLDRDASRGWMGQGTALVVDDDPEAARTTSRVLGTLGLTPVVVSSGKEAIEALRNAEAPLALVVLDVVMPDMDGEETLSHLRQLDPDLPVLFYSGLEDDLAERLDLDDNTAFLPKPFSFRDLQHHVKHLARRQSTPADV